MIKQASFDVIGKVESPYKEKFAIPRQPGLVSAAKGHIHFSPEFSQPELVKGLADFSHIWVIFLFHGTMAQGWKPMVRPPRLGGNEKVGVLATRSTFRPNPIGMSVVKLDDVIIEHGRAQLNISSFDLMDQTPIIDIKPYLPYADALTTASGGYAQKKPQADKLISFSKQAKSVCDSSPKQEQLTLLIEQVLSQDPRPAYKQHKPDPKTYGIRLFHYNILWRVVDNQAIIVERIEADAIEAKQMKAQ